MLSAVRAGAIAWVGLAAVAAALSLWVVRGQRTSDVDLPALDSGRPLPQGGFWVGACSEPADLNPFTSSDAVARSMVLRYTHDTLLERQPDTGEPIAAAAEAVDLEPSGDALSVRLRPDLRFADGAPLAVARSVRGRGRPGPCRPASAR